MTDDTSDDWSKKVNKLTSRSKELASKGFESSKEIGKNLASKSKKVASKGLESSKVASNKLAEKSKEVAVKGIEGTKSAVQSLSKAGQDHIENRKEKKEKRKDTSELEEIPQTDSIPVTEGEVLESKVSEDYSGFTVNELKLRLKLLGLAAGGKKAALVERLKSARKVKLEKDESTVLDDLEIKIQRIEEEYPEVLKPLPPEQEENYSQMFKNSLYPLCGFTLMIYSILILLPAVFNGQFGDSLFGLPFIEFFLPTWFSPEQIQPMASKYHVPFVFFGALVVFVSGVLLFQKRNFGTTVLCMYFFRVSNTSLN